MTKLPGPVRRVPLVLVGGLGASLVGVFLFGKIADEVWEHETMAFDTRLVAAAREVRTPALDRVMATVALLGEPAAIGLFAAGVGLRWLAERRKADIATGALAVLGGSLINQVLKRLFRRPRPALELRHAHATGYSFPSGHAMTTLVTYGTCAYLVSRRGGLTGHPVARVIWPPVLLLCALVGGSRVYLEVHYPTDVIAGWAAATVWLTTCGIARGHMEPEES
jgi:undecaprenyl-diphosphatase